MTTGTYDQMLAWARFRMKLVAEERAYASTAEEEMFHLIEHQAKLIEVARMRLVQIASGDYKACGVFAEDCAKDALTALSGNNIVE